MSDIQNEARALVAFYDERGKDWTFALAFILCRELFGRFNIVKVNEGEYITRHKYKRSQKEASHGRA